MQKKIPYPNDERFGKGVMAVGRLYQLPDEVIEGGHTFYGFETIGPRVYALYKDASKETKFIRVRVQEIIRTYRDEDCPECHFPETIIVRDAKTMQPIRQECSHRCGWSKEIKK